VESLVTSRPIPKELLPWALECLGVSTSDRLPALAVVAGDASNRRYFRLQQDGTSYILVEAPPATENNDAFLAVRDLLAAAGVKVPELHAADLRRGFLLLEDLGDDLLLPRLDPGSADGHYRRACDILLQMARPVPGVEVLPAYDRMLLEEELGRFPGWFVEKLLGHRLDNGERDLLAGVFSKLVASALEQPRVLVHRDFHSRNLMLQADGQLAVIDFQDAVRGPVSYDLVSLLRDCYIRWPASQVRAWALAHRDSLRSADLLPVVADDIFLRWFDWMGLQRHIKVLGTFARLYLRDDKPAYLDDLPLVIDYVLEVLEKYAGEEPVFAECRRWFGERLSPLIARQGWSEPL
jgi:N-acetylmuramate 1-kinase